MKKILATLALVGVASLVAWSLIAPPATADRISDLVVDRIKDPPNGYAAIVCSVWNNDSDPDGEYTSMDPGTGKYFHRVQIYANAMSAGQTFTIRFWETTTDSTSIGGGAMVMDAINTEGGLIADFPIQCAWLTFTGVAATDDITVIGYLKTTTGPTVAAD